MSGEASSRIRSLSLTFMLLLSLLATAISPSVSAVGPNQNDLNSGGDLPDNTSVNITNYIFSGSYSGTGELTWGDDNDILRVALNANQGLSASLSFPSTTTFNNSTTVTNDFDLTFLDSNLNFLGQSSFGNPETLSTNTTGGAGAMVYIDISRYSGSGSWSLSLYKFTVSNGTGGTGGGGGNFTSVVNCSGNNTVTPDPLEPNDSTATATSASLLPMICTGLSLDSGSDVDYYEIDTVAGVTYYVNVTFIDANGDIDVGWDDASGSFITSSTGTSNLESMSHTATTNRTTYVDVYGYLGATNTYDIEITTDNPSGGQTAEVVNVVLHSATHATLEFAGLTAGTNYSYNHTYGQVFYDDSTQWGTSSTGMFTAANTTHSVNITFMPDMEESTLTVAATLFGPGGAAQNTDTAELYIENMEAMSTSSTTGTIDLTNLSTSTTYDVRWMVINYDTFFDNVTVSNNPYDALNVSLHDSDMWTLTPTTSSVTYQVNWSIPLSLDEHLLVTALSVNGTMVDLITNENLTGGHFDAFFPQLPSLEIDAFSASSTATSNNVRAKGLDLVVSDTYRYQYAVTDAGGAVLASSSVTAFTATSQNMSLPMFNYTTPTASGTYCVVIDLYTNSMQQLPGDDACFQLVFDDDNDGVANEVDLCNNTAPSTPVDANGCALSQKDTDGDGYNDAVDDFPNDSTQWSDMDGDGHGDNASGNMADAFPTDASQWADADGDGYGDNASGNAPDAFPQDATQWADSDGDGYGDNPNGNYPDLWPADATQWEDMDGDGYGDNPAGTNGDAFPSDATQWSDADGDGYGDNASGTDPDAFPNDNTQWEDMDGDGYGDNANGNNGDKFPNDASQWFDADGDGYGDNQAGTDPDAFPNDSTQWTDGDGDGYGDNAAGMNADMFPNDSTQWFDADGDGYGDNANGNSPDRCLNTPPGEAVDSEGCAASQLDADMDGVNDRNDACPNTPAGETVDAVGCSGSQEDADNDGVMDAFDACPSTTLGSIVDAAGCALYQLDTDGDTITDNIDQCPTTTAGSIVNGVGCAANERDTDGDGVNDANDVCDGTSMSESPDAVGCSPSQKDTDGDLVNDLLDQCPGTANGAEVDLTGCDDTQLDDDGDGIPNSADLCRITPEAEQADQVGCSDSQKDEDNDDISNARDLCPDTLAGDSVDVDGCADRQKDSDTDGVMDHLDRCINTMEGEIVDDEGCALSQKDSDGDGVNDAEDAFKFDANESVDTDGDGVADRYDAFPEDPTQSQALVEEGGSGLMYGLIALIVLALIGGAGFTVMRKQNTDTISPFAEAANAMDAATELHMGSADKALPSLDDATQQHQQWEENGVHWSKDAEGNLSYFDDGAQAWMPFEQ